MADDGYSQYETGESRPNLDGLTEMRIHPTSFGLAAITCKDITDGAFLNYLSHKLWTSAVWIAKEVPALPASFAEMGLRFDKFHAIRNNGKIMWK